MEFFIWLLINLFMLGLFFGLFFLVGWIKEKVDQIPSLLRWILILPYVALALTSVDGGARTIGHLLALVWPKRDVAFNVYFGAYMILPFITSYTIVIASSIMAPKLKVPIAYFFSLVVACFYIFTFYYEIDMGINITADTRLLDPYSLEPGLIGSFLYLLFTFGGIFFAVMHAKAETSFLDN